MALIRVLPARDYKVHDDGTRSFLIDEIKSSRKGVFKETYRVVKHPEPSKEIKSKVYISEERINPEDSLDSIVC